MSAVLDVVEAHLAAYNDRDVERLVEGFAEDAVFATSEHLVVGRRGVRGFFTDAFDGPGRGALELRRAVVQGDSAACELLQHLSLGDDTADLDIAAFYTVREGLLARVRVYRDGN